MISPVAPSELLGEQVLTVGLALSSLAGDSVADVQSERPWCSKTLALVNTFMFFPIILHLLNAPWCLAGVEGPQPLAVRPAARGSWLCSAKPQVWGLASPRGCPVWLWGRICRLEQDLEALFPVGPSPAALIQQSRIGGAVPAQTSQPSSSFLAVFPHRGCPESRLRAEHAASAPGREGGTGASCRSASGQEELLKLQITCILLLRGTCVTKQLNCLFRKT